MAKTFPFPEWCPDISSLGGATTQVIENVVPRADGYGPFPSFEAFTASLPAGCRCHYFARKSDGSIAIFAGTLNRLYLLNNTTFTWEDVSKAGAAYGDLVSDRNWEFKQYNDLVLATQINTAVQKFILSSSTEFEDLGGSPPQAGSIAIVNRFVMLTDLLTAKKRVQWSDLDAPESWTAGVGLADYQDLPDGGNALKVAGGDMYGAIFQDETIRVLTYAPGSAVTFQITRVSTNDTLFGNYSVAEVNGYIYFCSAAGFKVIRPGGQPTPIGKERVDRTFFADVDTASLRLFIACVDPQSTRVYWSYKSLQGDTDLFDKMLAYDWGVSDNGKWTRLSISGEYLASLARPGITLEGLDALAPTPLNITNAVDNGSGEIRLTLDSLSNSDFAIAGQNFIVVYGVEGTTEANGTWVVTIVSPTQIDLNGSVFANAYTGGGHIGGSLDALPFSLDSISLASLASLSAVSSTHRAGFFTGANLEAVMETAEQDLEGSTVFISGLRPITDAAGMMCSIGGRFTAQAAVVYTAEAAIDTDDGECGLEVETRYARARGRVPAGEVWTYARGIQPDAQLAGDR